MYVNGFIERGLKLVRSCRTLGQGQARVSKMFDTNANGAWNGARNFDHAQHLVTKLSR
jgi:hypothetical protein